LSFFSISQYRIGLGGFLEFFLRLFIALVPVRMILQSQLSINPLDLDVSHVP
jgi:hypothetical protein